MQNRSQCIHTWKPDADNLPSLYSKTYDFFSSFFYPFKISSRCLRLFENFISVKNSYTRMTKKKGVKYTLANRAGYDDPLSLFATSTPPRSKFETSLGTVNVAIFKFPKREDTIDVRGIFFSRFFPLYFPSHRLGNFIDV